MSTRKARRRSRTVTRASLPHIPYAARRSFAAAVADWTVGGRWADGGRAVAGRWLDGGRAAYWAAMSTRVVVPIADGEIPGILWLPASGSGPGIVLVQEIFGLSPYIHRRAADLAALGYVVLAPQVFWRLGAESVPDGPTMLQEGIELVSKIDWPAAVGDVIAAVGWLRDRPEVRGGVGLVGLCFGGGLAYHVAAETQVEALVSYYGSALPGLVDTIPPVQAPSLHHFGAADSFIDAAAVERIRAIVGQAPACEFHLYPGADHAFDNPDFVLYHAEASAQAWDRTVEFLGRILPVG